MRGDAAAADAIAQLIDISHVWDDLIDKDRTPSDGEVNRAFQCALLGLPSNPFWRANQDALTLLLRHAIIDWHTANDLEASKNLPASFVLRTSAASLIVHAAAVIGGFDWALQVSKEVRAFHLDDYEAYRREHGE